MAIDEGADLVDAAGDRGLRIAARDDRRRPGHREVADDGRLVERDRGRPRAHRDGRHRRHRVHHGIGEDHRREPRGAALQISPRELLARAEVAVLGAHDDGEPGPGSDARILHGEAARRHREAADPREPTGLARIDEGGQPRVVHLGREPARAGLGDKGAKRADPRSAEGERLRHRRSPPRGERIDRAHPGDDHPPPLRGGAARRTRHQSP